MISYRYIIGKVINRRYQVEGLLGEGAIAYVYKAMDLKSKKLVALKIYKDDRDFANYADNETLILELLSGQNAPILLEKFWENGLFHVVIEYLGDAIRGEELLELSLSDRTEIARQLLRCIANTHSMNIVNNDLKFSDFCWRPQMKRLVILDWNVAQKRNFSREEFADNLRLATKLANKIIQKNAEMEHINTGSLPTELPLELTNMIKWAENSEGKSKDWAKDIPFHASQASQQISTPYYEKFIAKRTPAKKHKRGKLIKLILAVILAICIISALVTLIMIFR